MCFELYFICILKMFMLVINVVCLYLIEGVDLYDFFISVGDIGIENVCGVFEGLG